MTDKRSETADSRHHHLTFILTDRTGKVKKFQSLFQCDRVDGLAFHQRGELGLRRLLVFGMGNSDLNDRAVTADLHKHRIAALRVHAELTFPYLMFGLDGSRGLYDRMENLIEFIDSLCPDQLAFRNRVKFLFNAGRKVVIQHIREILHQEVVHHRTDIGRHQLIAVGPDGLGLHRLLDLSPGERKDRVGTFRAFLIPFHHIFAVLDRLDRRRVCGRTPDTQFFQTTDQAGFRIARRTLRETFRCHDIIQRQCLMKLYRRKQAVFLLFLHIVIIAFHVDLEETFETDHFADSDKTFGLPADTDRNSRAFQFGICHLASDRAFTDQFIQFLFLRRVSRLHIADISRANRFVSFLRPFAFGMVLAELVIFLTVCPENSFFRRA